MSWVKNFGVADTVFMLQQEKWRRADHVNAMAPSQQDVDKIIKDSRQYHTTFAILLPAQTDQSLILNRQLYPKYEVYEIPEGESIASAADRCQEEYLLVIDRGVTLSPVALWAFAKKIEETGGDFVYSDEVLNGMKMYKPDFGIDTLGGQNYLGEVWCMKRSVWHALGGIGDVDIAKAMYDMALKAYEAGYAIQHVPKLLYRCDRDPAAEPMCGQPLTQNDTEYQHYQECVGRIAKRASASADPLISILIPNKDHIDLLERCIRSILSKSTYGHYEILIIENNSEEKRTFDYYEKLEESEKIRVIRCITDWNYSYINNYGVKQMQGDYCLFLNNDTEVIAEDWMEQMLRFAMRKDVGAVGAKLFYPDGTIQHGGVTMGIRGVAGHAFHGRPGDDPGYMSRLITVQNLSAVTAACLMVPREVFDEVGGFDEDYKVAFNDTDLCMRIRKQGYLIVYNPKAQLLHYESKSRGNDEQSPEKLKRFFGETMRFQKQWRRELTMGDPYYNPNLSVSDDEFSFVE